MYAGRQVERPPSHIVTGELKLLKPTRRHLQFVLQREVAICGSGRPKLTPAYKLRVWPCDVIPYVHSLLSDLLSDSMTWTSY